MEGPTGPITIERVVAFVLAPVITGLSAFFTSWAAANLPGQPSYDSTQLAALGIAGAAAGLAAVLKWLHGRQKTEQHAAELESAAQWNASHADAALAPDVLASAVAEGIARAQGNAVPQGAGDKGC